MNEDFFPTRLNTLRTKTGISARDMSLSLGQNPGYINNIENKNYTIIESRVKLMANVSIRMDDALKKLAEELFNDLGMNLTTAFTIFVKQAIREQGIPFEITKETPNSETLSALREVEEMKKNPSLGKSYTDVDKMMEDLLS